MSTRVSVLQVLRRSAYLALAPAVVLAGCTQMKIDMGMRMLIAKLPVNQMEVHLAKPQGVAPGQRIPLVVTFAGPNGQTWATEGAGRGAIMWEDLTITSTIMTYNNDGTVSLPVDPRLSDGKTGHVLVTLAFNPDLRAEVDIPSRYDQKYYAEFNGKAGSNGNNVRGERDGSPGGRGPDVTIRLVMHPGNRSLIEAAVQPADGEVTLFLIDPNGGSLSVSSYGGPGGAGNSEVSSGLDRGGIGSAGIERSGSDGARGRGGKITVIYDPAVAPYLGVLQLSSLGGPEPVFTSRNLDPLW
jgi:hypothetical protein